jgi:diguanylate cyclase
MVQNSTSGQQVSAQKIEQLAGVIIETLKELSSQRQPLTPAALCQALSPKKEIIQLLTPSPKPQGLTTEGTEPRAQQRIQELEVRLQESRNQEQVLARAAEELQAQTAQAMAFYKKAILSLIILAQETESDSLRATLDQLRVLIANDAKFEHQEECLQRIKDLVLKEHPGGRGGETAEAKSSPFWASLLKRSDSSKKHEQPVEQNHFVPSVQDVFLKILFQFQFTPNEEYLPRLVELQQRIRSCGAFDTLIGIGEEMVTTIQDYVSKLSAERSHVAAFVTEFSKNFLEMETQLLASLTDTRETYQVSQVFSDALKGQMDEIKDSFNISKTLEEVRGMVFSKLQDIKHALESKRREDILRLEKYNRKMGELQQSLQNMTKKINLVQERTKTLEQEVLLDSLTNTHNRRAYELRIDEELQRFQRYNHLFSLILFDVDHFKQVNDQYGHRAGDKCLREIINRIKPSLRKVDFLARFGGEEFILILTGTDKENALKVAEKLRRLIEKTRFLYQGQEIPVTISLGVTQAGPADKDSQNLFSRVDAAMYAAKNAGRNQVCAL